NPANDILKLDLGKSYPSVQVRIYNLFGQVLLEREYGDLNTTELDIQDFAPGLYTIGIETEESQGIVKFVKD
ncbi:MAG: T9SS type A sorting domain-containing protein, partial [Bacteroidia bacterium]|nr:T9SS type A sorting domain-containing protein [Bacteroidia bacterium]